MNLSTEKQLIPFNPSQLPAGPYLVFAPHPDDETLGMGGTLALAAKESIETKVMIVTDGQAGGDAKTRKSELERALAHLGLEGAQEFWDFPDRKLTAFSTTIVERIRKTIERVRPGTIFFPSPLEFHPDHRVLAALIWQAVQSLTGPSWPLALWHYEISRQAETNRLIDITRVMDLKLGAIDQFKSQLAMQEYKDVATGINMARRFTLGKDTAYAEAFFQYDLKRIKDSGIGIYDYYLDQLKGYAWTAALDESWPLVSIIIRTKDRPNRLKEALASVLEQSYPKIEALVINDGEQDISFAQQLFAHDPGKEVRILATQEKGDRVAAANLGINQSKGHLIAFLDDDDLLMPQGIEALVETSMDYGMKRPVYGIVEARDQDGKLKRIYDKPFSKVELFLSNYIPIHAIIIPKPLIDKVGPLDPAFPIFEDWDWFYRLAKETDFVFLRRLVGIYRILTEATITGRGGDTLHREARIKFYKKHWGDLDIGLMMEIEGIRLALQEEIRSLKEDLDEKEAQFYSQLTNISRERQALETRLRECTSRMGELNWEVEDLKKVYKKLVEEKEDLSATIKDLREEKATLQAKIALWEQGHGTWKRCAGTLIKAAFLKVLPFLK